MKGTDHMKVNLRSQILAPTTTRGRPSRRFAHLPEHAFMPVAAPAKNFAVA